jgi:hypothetical protein
MEYKHKQGPWTVSHEESPLDHRMELTVRDDDGLLVCSFIGDDSDFANAHLIAAAPDLLSALKALVDDAGPEAGPEHGKAADVIAKATKAMKGK